MKLLWQNDSGYPRGVCLNTCWIYPQLTLFFNNIWFIQQGKKCVTMRGEMNTPEMREKWDSMKWYLEILSIWSCVMYDSFLCQSRSKTSAALRHLSTHWCFQNILWFDRRSHACEVLACKINTYINKSFSCWLNKHVPSDTKCIYCGNTKVEILAGLVLGKDKAFNDNHHLTLLSWEFLRDLLRREISTH